MVVRAGNTAEESLESYARRLVAGCTWKPAQVAGRNLPELEKKIKELEKMIARLLAEKV